MSIAHPWRKRRLGLLTVILMFGGLSVDGIRADEPRLLDHAVRVAAPEADWNEGYGLVPWDHLGNQYYWLSAHRVIIFRFQKEKSEARHQDLWVLSLRDLGTKKETPLPALTAMFNASGSQHSFCRVSPDGKWLLFPTQQGESVVNLDSRRTISWSIPWNPAQKEYTLDTAWLGDSRHWATLMAKNVPALHETAMKPHPVSMPTRIILRDLRAPNSRRTIRMKPMRVFRPPPDIITSAPTLTWGGHIFTVCLYDPSIFRLVDVTPGPHPITHHLAVPAPPGTALVSDDISPQGNRILLECVVKDDYHATIRSLWVARLDGSGMHEIGTIDLATPGNHVSESVSKPPAIYDIRWLPDGQHLSFRHDSGLYIIRA